MEIRRGLDYHYGLTPLLTIAAHDKTGQDVGLEYFLDHSCTYSSVSDSWKVLSYSVV